jgi:RNAse (barnase) inhibitor barstar
MVDLTSFIMGIGLVLGVLGVGVVVMMYIQIKRLKSKCSQLEQVQGHIFNDINRVSEELHRRIDGEIKRTDELYTETNRYINARADETHKGFDEVYKNMDSRFDKLINKLNVTPVSKEFLKD